jgi:hypothetical protein
MLSKFQPIVDSVLSLNCSPLAVAPKEANNCGKRPSYIKSIGSAVDIQHSLYQNKRPSKSTLEDWFSNEANGIGMLCSDSIVCVDVDAKHFTSVDECESVVEDWLEKHNLKGGWIERSINGGYHIFLSLSSPKDFTNFRFEGVTDFQCGEVLGKSRFVVLAPTNGYKLIGDRHSIPTVENLESVGIVAHKKSKVIATDRSSKPSNRNDTATDRSSKPSTKVKDPQTP